MLRSTEIKIIANPNLNIDSLIKLAKLPIRSLQIYASIKLYVKPEQVKRVRIVKEPKDAPVTKDTILTLKAEYEHGNILQSRFDKFIVHSTSLQDKEQIIEDVRSRLTTIVQDVFFNKVRELGGKFNLVPHTAKNVIK